jgi:murein DD-endopeptidase MepM/ murein hydrolase activator NlpD
MSDCVALTVKRSASLALTGIVGIWLSGCAESGRFADNGNPFANPFATASNDTPATSTPTPKISSKPLPPAGGYATSARPSPTAVSSTPTPAPATTGSIHPRSDAVGGTAAGWTAVGGSPVIVGSADDAATLSARYGVPQAALLSANGLHSASEVHGGMRVVIPVYNVHGDTHVAKADDEDAKPRHTAKSEDDADKPRHSAKKDDEDSKPVHKAKADDDEDKPRHKAKAKPDDDADADDDKPKSKKAHKDQAEADKPAHEKVAKADDESKPAKALKKTAEADAPKKDVLKAPKEAAKPEKAAPAPQVAKSDPPKANKAPAIDKTPTADIGASASSASGDTESGEFRWPARGRIIQGFKQGGNDGINIALPEGTSVRAAEDGKVAYAGSALKGYGNLVLIRHPNGFVTAYANNGELNVKSGDVVKRGQVIAKSGQTGDVSTPQLHFEVRKGQTPVDPTSHLAGL